MQRQNNGQLFPEGLQFTVLELLKAIRERSSRIEPQIRFLANEDIQTEIVEMIKRTVRKISIISPWVGEVLPITELKGEIIKRNVLARLIIRPFKFYNEKRTVLLRELFDLGVQIEVSSYIHAKMIIVDKDEMVVMSSNLTPYSMVRNDEVGIWTKDAESIKNALSYFNELMNKSLYERTTK